MIIPSVKIARNELVQAQKKGKLYVSIGIGAFLVVSVYQTFYSIIQKEGMFNLENLIAAFLLAMFIFLCFSNIVLAISTFFFSKDLNLFLASPISNQKFITNKIVTILSGSVWIILVFGLPTILAIGTATSSGTNFYITSMLGLLCIFMLSAIIASIFALLIAYFVPLNRKKEICLGIATIGLFALIGSPNSVDISSNINFQKENLEFLQQISSYSYLPTNWLTSSMIDSISSSPLSSFKLLLFPFAFTLSAFFLLCLIKAACYNKGLEQCTGSRETHSQNKNIMPNFIIEKLNTINSFSKGFILKEIKIFSRNIIYAVQLVLIIALSTIYLNNLKFIAKPENLDFFQLIWWKFALVLLNIFMGSFILLTICTRFVFPAISLEGKSFWIIKSSPLSTKAFLKAKFNSFLFPISLISLMIFLSGTFSINSSFKYMTLTAIASFFIAYSFTAIGIAFGAIFSKFDWNDSAQLTVGLGSIIYMLCCGMLFFINLVPISVLGFIDTLYTNGSIVSQEHWIMTLICTFILLSVINYSISRYALKVGVSYLDKSS